MNSHSCIYLSLGLGILICRFLSWIPKNTNIFGIHNTHWKKALKAILNGEVTLNNASKFYNIPKSTLHNKLTHKVTWERKMGPATELTKTEEEELEEWLLNKAELGLPMHPDEVFDTVENYSNSINRKSQFKDNRPGERWLKLFLKRHPTITKRNAEMISKARAN